MQANSCVLAWLWLVQFKHLFLNSPAELCKQMEDESDLDSGAVTVNLQSSAHSFVW